MLVARRRYRLALAQNSDVEAGLAPGANYYLTKPLSPLELLKIIDQALDQALDPAS